ncbi:MAG TPA: hypothetical protein VM146_16210 [Steroidobacteraceae bacterium]|nr:hypothetical protein [Steroidobacteraceae bacterium]
MKLFTGIVAVFFLAACGTRASDDEQVRELIVTAENAAEARDASDVIAVVASDYTDAQGFDRAQLENFLRGYFLSHPKVELRVSVQDLQFPVDGLGRATIDVTSLPAGEQATLSVEFRKESGAWRIARADKILE